MPLLGLPNELLLIIAEVLKPETPGESPKDFIHLLQTNRHLASLLTPFLHGLHETALRDRGYLSALAWAACHGHLGLVRLALDKGANANAATTEGSCFYTPLLWAVQGESEEVVKLLLERGAQINLGVPNFTALHLATEKDDEEMIKLLLEHGANTELREDMGLTPLLIARGKRAVRLLLDHGANIDARHVGPVNGGMTALHLAAMREQEPIVRLLLERGASILVDKDGRAPRDFTASKMIEKLLVEKECGGVCTTLDSLEV